jgi:amino acid transporter
VSSSSVNKDANGGSTGTAAGGAAEQTNVGFVRSIRLPTAIAINMTQMCGIGPFITIPLMVVAFGGPQAILGWIAGAILALADGLIWAELGAAMPGAGGTYLYLREAFQYRTGRLIPFIFSWTAILFIPLIMSTGVIGLVQYLGYLWPNMNWWEIHLVSLIVVGVVLFALYRRIESIGYLTVILFGIMLLSIGAVIVASFTHFTPGLAFTYPPNAFTLNGAFFAGLLGGSRVPYNAARDGVFLRQFGKLHPRYHFPHIALIVMCVITAIASFFTLSIVIATLTAVIVIVQAVGQVAALTALRRRQPNLRRPYRMWLYPLPSIIALAGWVYVFVASGLSGTQFILPIWTNPMILAIGWVVLGIIAYLFWARYVEHTWPFGPKEIKEEYLETPVEAEVSA